MTVTDPLFDISGKVVIVAGAGGGIGGPLAKALHQRGARMVLFDIDASRLGMVADALEGTDSLVADIRDEAAVRDVVARAIDRFGRLDAAVNAAGILPIESAMPMEYSAFEECISVNLNGAFLLSRTAATAMLDGGGRIVHLASVSSFVSNERYAAYASSKAGLAQLVRVLAREWAGRGITVNAIGPALTDTPLTRDYLANSEFLERSIAAIPMGRLGTPDDLIATAILLLAPGGAFITGQTICVDGGRTLV